MGQGLVVIVVALSNKEIMTAQGKFIYLYHFFFCYISSSNVYFINSLFFLSVI